VSVVPAGAFGEGEAVEEDAGGGLHSGQLSAVSSQRSAVRPLLSRSLQFVVSSS
jgi:hypothetical protein